MNVNNCTHTFVLVYSFLYIGILKVVVFLWYKCFSDPTNYNKLKK